MTDKHLMIVPEKTKPTYLEEVARTNAIADQDEREVQQRAIAQQVNEDVWRCAQCWIALWAELKELNGIAIAGQGKSLQNAIQGRRGRLYAYLKTFQDALITFGMAARDHPELPDYQQVSRQAEQLIDRIDKAIIAVIKDAARGRELLVEAMSKFSMLPTPSGISNAGRQRSEMDDLIYTRALPLVKARGRKWQEVSQLLCEAVIEKQHAGLPLNQADKAINQMWLETETSDRDRANHLRMIFRFRQHFS